MEFHADDDLYLLIFMVLTIAGFLFWLNIIIRIAFSALDYCYKLVAVIAGGIVIFTALQIFVVFGHAIGFIVFPIVTISYYLAATRAGWKKDR